MSLIRKKVTIIEETKYIFYPCCSKITLAMKDTDIGFSSFLGKLFILAGKVKCEFPEYEINYCPFCGTKIK